MEVGNETDLRGVLTEFCDSADSGAEFVDVFISPFMLAVDSAA